MITQLVLHHDGKFLGDCGPTCQNATVDPCPCICNGTNYGQGEQHAIDNARSLARNIGHNFKHLTGRLTLVVQTTYLCKNPDRIKRTPAPENEASANDHLHHPDP